MDKSQKIKRNDLRFYVVSLWEMLMSIGLAAIAGVTLVIFATIILALTDIINFPQLVWLPVLVIWLAVAFKCGEERGYKKGFKIGDTNGYERGLMMSESETGIEILPGVILSEKHWSAVYRWAQKSPENVKKSIEGMMKKQGFESPEAALTILESDLSHL